jgi:hypothetical protein
MRDDLMAKVRIVGLYKKPFGILDSYFLGSTTKIFLGIFRFTPKIKRNLPC